MLVLTRKTQQQIQIGDNITITILQVKGQAVRVGIEAPRDVRIIRRELDAVAPEPVAKASVVKTVVQNAVQQPVANVASQPTAHARRQSAGAAPLGFAMRSLKVSAPRPEAMDERTVLVG